MANADKHQNKTVDPDLVTAVAHDLKTPVGAVRGFLELMEHVGPLNDEQKRLSERIVGALEHMQEVIADFEDIARLDSGIVPDMEMVDFVVLCEEAVNIVRGIAGKKQINVLIVPPSEPFNVLCDAHRMRRVVINLLSNAIKYNAKLGEVKLVIGKDGQTVRIDVIDNGIGIEAEEQPRIFDRFYRARTTRDKRVSGSGLGLAIAKLIVEQHQGRIWLESEPGVGSTFSFSIPFGLEKNPTVRD